jgi:branched-chain amino acid transport system substrate-binding protein
MNRLSKWVVLLSAALFAGPAVAKDTIKIGALLSVTGPASNLGGPEARTLQMLVDEANKKGGVGGHTIELLLKDTSGSPEKAISLAKKLIEEDKVFAIIGPSTSGETLKIKAIAEENKTLLLSCAAAEAIVKPLAKWVFKTPQNDSHAARKILEHIKQAGLTKVGLVSSNTGFGKAGKEQVEKLAKELGLEIVANEVYEKEATDLTAVATKLKAAGVEAFINWSIEPAQAIVLKNARQIGLTVPAYQSHGFGNIQYVKAAGPAAEGVIFPAGRLLVADVLPASHPQKTVLMKYKKDYEAKYKEDVSTFGGHAYDAFLILSKIIEKAGADREKARTELEGLHGLVGTAGVFNFSAQDHNGLQMDAFEMLTVKQGKFAVLQAAATKKEEGVAKKEEGAAKKEEGVAKKEASAKKNKK